MNIIGPEYLTFGVDDVRACVQYLIDYGLKPLDVDDQGAFLKHWTVPGC